jgi:hypothetical protein
VRRGCTCRMSDDVHIHAKHLQLLRELASRSLTFDDRGSLTHVPAGFDLGEVERAMTQPELDMGTPEEPTMSFVYAWTAAMDRADYDPDAWRRKMETRPGRTRKTLDAWCEFVYAPDEDGL